MVILRYYIRAVGLLYLRYVCAPAQLWDWYEYYLEDDEEIAISSGLHPTKVTVGGLIRMLILEPKFQGTMLPRIPIPIARDLEKKLKEYDANKTKDKGRSRSPDDDRYRKDDRYRSRSPNDRYRKDDRYKSRDRYRSRSPNDRYRKDDRYKSRDRYRSKSPRRDDLDDYDRYRKDRYRRRDSRDRDYRR
ncbi:unnamed protein product [Rhizopus stolonifer]